MTLAPPTDRRVDVLQHALASLPPVECPLVHRFTPGLYSREMQIPAGTAVVSRVHKTEHQFAVLAGSALVWTKEGGVVRLDAGHIGTTPAGTRRAVFVLEDCRWVTFHPTTTTDLDQLQEELTHTPDVSYVDGDPECKAIIDEIRRQVLAEQLKEKNK